MDIEFSPANKHCTLAQGRHNGHHYANYPPSATRTVTDSRLWSVQHLDKSVRIDCRVLNVPHIVVLWGESVTFNNSWETSYHIVPKKKYKYAKKPSDVLDIYDLSAFYRLLFFQHCGNSFGKDISVPSLQSKLHKSLLARISCRRTLTQPLQNNCDFKSVLRVEWTQKKSHRVIQSLRI